MLGLKKQKATNLNNLAPMIYRQRLVIEGHPSAPITDEHIKDYLSKLSGVLNMKTVLDPVTHKSDKYGWAGWIHWETSGAHFYAWDQPVLFFSADIYTCKPFEVSKAVEFTKDYFKATQLGYKEF